MYGWFDASTETGRAVFTLLTGRLLDALSNKEWVCVV